MGSMRRRSVLSVSAICAFAVIGCRGEPPTAVESTAGPLEIATSTARGGELLQRVQRQFRVPSSRRTPEHPFLAASAVQGFVREGDEANPMLFALTSAPRGRAPSTSVRIPVAGDGALRVATGAMQVTVKPRG